MAPDERDRIFDKALARHLRSAAPAGEVVKFSESSASQNSACPDPETLAAYHERSLLPEQLNSLKEHIVGCPNCQTVLAHLEMTDEISLQAAEEERVFAQTVAAPVAAASSQTQAPSPKASHWKSRRARLLRGARWQWLAPAGALAASLLVWIALHENQPLPLPALSESESKMANNQVPPAPIPSGPARVPQSSAPAGPAVALVRPQSRLSEKAIANGRMTSDAIKQSQTSSGAAGARSADIQTGKELRAGKDRERDASADELTAANRADLDTKNLPEAMQQKVQLQSPAASVQAEITPSQNAQIQNQTNNYAAQKVAGPSPLNQAESSKKAKRETAAAATPAPSTPPPQPATVSGVASSYSDSASLMIVGGISNPRLISPPGSNLIWRVGRSGLIEFSKDGGAFWFTQASGVLVDLLSGSAPSDKVCWIVGRLGTVLLTTDGGAHWNLLSSPMKDDLGGVQASDALHARIWNSLKTKSFETSDGGVTWKRSVNQ